MPKENIQNEDIWEEAKDAVDKDKYDEDSYYAVVTDVYKNMGGKFKNSATDDLYESQGFKDWVQRLGDDEWLADQNSIVYFELEKVQKHLVNAIEGLMDLKNDEDLEGYDFSQVDQLKDRLNEINLDIKEMSSRMQISKLNLSMKK